MTATSASTASTTADAQFELMVSAATIASDIQGAYEHSDRIVVRAAEHPDALLATKAALQGTQHHGLRYQQVAIAAEHGIHGGSLAGSNFPFHADPEETDAVESELAEIAATGTIPQVIVTVKSDHALSDLHLIPVLSDLSQQLDAVALRAGLYLSNHSVVWIIDDQRKAY